MHCRRLIWIVPLAALFFGCRTQPHVNAHIESLNAEYRNLEDKLYVLKDENERMAADLGRLEEENRRLLGGDTSASPPRGNRRGRPAVSDDSLDIAPPEIEMGNDFSPQIEIPDTAPPATRPSAPSIRSTPPAILPRRTERLNLEPPLVKASEDEPESQPTSQPAASDLPAPPAVELEQPEPEPIDGRVTHIFLNPLLTGGDDRDRQPGDDGLSILLEPRNESEQYVPQAGVVSVVVLDPAKQGDAARVARWDFDLATTRQKLQRVAPARGIHLQMPWPAKPPEANKLRLFVRYETPDGRKLQADREIFVTQPGQYSHRWTPRPPDRPRRAAPAAVAQQPQPQAVTAQETATIDAPVLAPSPTPTPAPKVADKAATPSTTPNVAAGKPAKASAPLAQPAKEPAVEAKRDRPQWRPYR